MFKVNLIGALATLLFIAEIRAGGATCLTPEGGVNPVFLSDSKNIMYIKEGGDGNKKLFVKEFNKKGAAAKEITDAESVLVSGNNIIYFSGPFFALSIQLYDLKSNKSEPVKVDNPPNGMAFSYDENTIIYPSGFGDDTKLIAVDLKSKKQSGTKVKLPAGTQAVSSDKKYAAVVFKNDSGVNSIKVVEIKSNKVVWTAKPYDSAGGMEIGGCHSPAFSPDGKYLAYVSAGIQPIADIYQLDLTTKKVKRITSDQADNQSPTYSPDSKKIAFSSAKGNTYRVWMISSK